MKNVFKLKQCFKRTAAAICSAAMLMTIVSSQVEIHIM